MKIVKEADDAFLHHSMFSFEGQAVVDSIVVKKPVE